jgi:hypothetical protein
MSNIVDFPNKEYKIKIKMPSSNVIQIRKKSTDNIRISIEDNILVASVSAINLYQAQDKVKQVFPNSSIIEEPWVAG